MKQKLEWKKPVVTRVELDPEQAVLEVCSQPAGYGAWLLLDAGAIWCTPGTAPGTRFCKTSPRDPIGGIIPLGRDEAAGS